LFVAFAFALAEQLSFLGVVVFLIECAAGKGVFSSSESLCKSSLLLFVGVGVISFAGARGAGVISFDRARSPRFGVVMAVAEVVAFFLTGASLAWILSSIVASKSLPFATVLLNAVFFSWV